MNTETEDIAAALAEARAENQRLRDALEKHLLPVMRLQKPQPIGGWNWPYLVEVAEKALNPTKP